jgi:pimeloyl-ACP methyl ester carboxylesterase
MRAAWLLWVLLALWSLPSALRAQEQTIDFEDLAGPSIFGSADPPLHELSATFSGGELLRNATFSPADQSSLYGTASFCNGCLPAIAIDFSQRVANLSLFLVNGEPFEVSYAVEADDGTTEVITLAANFDSGAGTVTIPDQNIRRVVVSGTSSTQWDFLIDDVRFTPSGPVLIDPVLSGLLRGPAVTTDADSLAASNDIVKGVGADGATQVVLRIPASQPGQRVMTAVLDDLGRPSDSIDDNGGLAPLGSSGSFASGLAVTAVATSQGPMAFAVYRAPTDFSRGAGDAGLSERHVTLQVTPNGGSASSTDVLVLRSPVVLIHGLWDAATTWDTFTPLVGDSRFYVRRVDYSDTVSGITASVPSYSAPDLAKVRANALGFGYNAHSVLNQLQGFLVDFRHDNNVAAVQADVVAHSMGGDIARTMALAGDFQSDDTFGRGPIHKLVTIGTPHLGTPLATEIVKSANSCVRGVLGQRFSLSSVSLSSSTVAGAVGDLSGDGHGGHLSAALASLSVNQPFRTAYIAGVMSQANLSGLDCGFFCHANEIRHYCSHDPLAMDLTSQLWRNVFGQDSDAIVPLASELRGGPGITITGVIHSGGLTDLSFNGPSELDEAGGIPAEVVVLLNERSNGSDFRR